RGAPEVPASPTPLLTTPQSDLQLADVLADPTVARDKQDALVSLYGRWGIEYRGQQSGFDCAREPLAGMRCLVKTGTWAKLRRFNQPAILELVSANGVKHYATLTTLSDDTATLDFGGRQFTFPLPQMERLWHGLFSMPLKS